MFLLYLQMLQILPRRKVSRGDQNLHHQENRGREAPLVAHRLYHLKVDAGQAKKIIRLQGSLFDQDVMKETGLAQTNRGTKVADQESERAIQEVAVELKELEKSLIKERKGVRTGN